ncbi:MAG: GNAT family N-acetyltransferase, partial [Thermoplasmata archaeon]|nr:GNAT family N-acetyltransferase [Thermoplasmata archaeon]
LGGPVIRELKVLGVEVPVGQDAHGSSELQHRGFGRRLVAEALEQALTGGWERLYVTSAVGTRGYYRRLGFEQAGPYQVKRLRAVG